jgi:hypothetical protein
MRATPRTTAAVSILLATIYASSAPHAEEPSDRPGQSGEYSLKDETDRALSTGQTGPAAPNPQPWLPMKMAYSDDTSAEMSEIVAAWKETKPAAYPKGGQGQSFIYQLYATETERAIVMIGMTPDCRFPLDPKAPAKGSRITYCPVRTFVVYRDRPPRIVRQWGCFEFNGQSPPGSATDPRYNADYTQLDTATKTVTIYTIKDGKPLPGCKAEINIAAPGARDDEK